MLRVGVVGYTTAKSLVTKIFGELGFAVKSTAKPDIIYESDDKPIGNKTPSVASHIKPTKTEMNRNDVYNFLLKKIRSNEGYEKADIDPATLKLSKTLAHGKIIVEIEGEPAGHVYFALKYKNGAYEFKSFKLLKKK